MGCGDFMGPSGVWSEVGGRRWDGIGLRGTGGGEECRFVRGGAAERLDEEGDGFAAGRAACATLQVGDAARAETGPRR